jgi:hypothetical protein
MGRPPGRPGRRVATRARVGASRGEFYPSAPRLTFPRLGLRDGCVCQRGRPGGQTGAGWGIRVASPAAVVQIREGGRNPQVPKPPTPLGFSLLSSPVSAP